MISTTSISTATQLADINSDPLRCRPSIADHLLVWEPAEALDPVRNGGKSFTTLIDISTLGFLMSKLVPVNMLCRVLLVAAFLLYLAEG